MTFTEFVNRYVSEHQLKPSTEEQYRYTVSQFERLAGQPGQPFHIRDLTADHVNTYLKQLEAQGRAAETLKGRRRNLLVLWRNARCQDLNNHPDDRVRKLRSEELIVDVWTASESRQLREAAESWIGQRNFENGTDEGLYWAAYVKTAWDSGLRRGDVLCLPSKTIRREFWVRQRKTGGLVKVELHDSTLAAIAKLEASGPKRHYPFAWPHCMEQFSAHARELIAAAGLRGTLKYLRRGCGTNIAQGHGKAAAASKKLGHKSTAVTEKHYLPRDWEETPSLLPEDI